MKKAPVLFLVLAMLLTIAGCSMTYINQSEGESAKDLADPPASADVGEPAAPDDSVEPEEPSIPVGEETDGETDEETDGTDPETVPVPEIRVSHTDVTLKSAGETFRFTVWDSDGNDPAVSAYTSANPEVAAVDKTGGEVTAVAPGTTTITAHVEIGGEKREFSCIVRCNWEDTEPAEDAEPSLPTSGTASLPSLSDFYTTLQGKYEGLGAMMVMEDELLDNYYPGLSDIAAVEEVLVQETMMSVANMAVGMVKLSSDATLDDIIAVQNIFQERITTQADGGAWYPESCATWENGVITSVSKVVGMFVYPDAAQSMADLFTETFSN